MSNPSPAATASSSANNLTTKAVVATPVDYSTCSFEVRLTKRKLFSHSIRFVYFSPTRIIICTEPYQQNPEKVIALTKRMNVKWINLETKSANSFKERAIGFMILNENEEVQEELYGDCYVMVPLQEFFSKQLFQLDFQKDYKIEDRIGKGKYAKVYKAVRKDTGESFAVKFLHKRKMKSIEDSEAALDNELQILRELSHQNCLQMVGCYQDQFGYYILTELLDVERTLSHEIERYKNRKFPSRLVKHILSQLLLGLEYIHSKGIMHRDLKPQNIMFAKGTSPENNNTKNIKAPSIQPIENVLCPLKLIDFGLAQYVANSNYIYVHVGTPGYVAPEILASESDQLRYNEKCDLFSIGVIFHTLLTGSVVFPGKKFEEVLEMNKQCQINLTGSRYEQVSTEALDLLGRLLQRDPRRRISAREALQHRYLTELNVDNSRSPVPSPMMNLSLTNKQNNKPSSSSNQTINNNGVDILAQRQKRPISTLGVMLGPEHSAKTATTTPYLSPRNNNLFIQLTSLKSMKSLASDSTNASSVEVLYRCTRDILELLNNLAQQQENIEQKETPLIRFESTNDDTQLKAENIHQIIPKINNSDQQQISLRPTQLKMNSHDESKEKDLHKQSEEQQPMLSNRSSKMNQLQINTKFPIDKNGAATNSTTTSTKAPPAAILQNNNKSKNLLNIELTNRKEYRCKLSMEQPTQNNPCEDDDDEEVDHNYEDDDDDDDYNQHENGDDKIEASNNFNHNIDSEKQMQSQQVSLFARQPLGAKNMILNEMSSPISPEFIRKSEEPSQQPRQPLRLRMEKVPFSSPPLQKVLPENNRSNEEERATSKLQSNNNNNNQEEKQQLKQNQNYLLKFPKETIEVIEFFPKELFTCYLQGDTQEIENAMPSRVYKFGIFLLYGQEETTSLESKDPLTQLKLISTKQLFHAWFLDMVASMLNPTESARPTIKALYETMSTHYSQ